MLRGESNMNERLLAERLDGYLYVFGQLKSLDGDNWNKGTTPAGLSPALFNIPYKEWEKCAQRHWATHKYNVPRPWNP